MDIETPNKEEPALENPRADRKSIEPFVQHDFESVVEFDPDDWNEEFVDGE